MSQTETLFRVRAPVTTVAATTAASAAKQLPKAGITLRVCNRSSVEAFFCVTDQSATAVAILPVDGTDLACYAGPGCDYTMSIKGDQQKWLSAITSAGAANLLFYVDEGS